MYELYAKQLSDQKLGHLYEHIVYDFISCELRHDLISIIDYDITPEVSYSGLVTISVWARNEAALSIIEAAMNASSAAVRKRNIERCVSQIACEKQSTIDYDPQRVRQALNAVAAQPWVKATGDGVIDVGRRTASMRDVASPLFVFKKTPEHFDHVGVALTCDTSVVLRDTPAGLYVFRRLAEIVQTELRTILAAQNIAAYWKDTSFGRTARHVEITQHLVFPKPANEDEYRRAFAMLDQLDEDAIAEKIEQYLASLDTHADYAIELNSDLYANFGTFVGANTLKTAVTPKMVKEVMNNVKMNAQLSD